MASSCSVEQIEADYCLMPENQTNEVTVSSHPQTRPAPKHDSTCQTDRHARTSSGSGKTGHRAVATSDSLAPLIAESDVDSGGEQEDRLDDVVFLSLEGDGNGRERTGGEIERADEEDALSPLPTSTSGKPRGILKKTSVVDSASSYQSSSGSPTKVEPTSPPPSIRLTRGGWRKESKVHFKKPNSADNTAFELESVGEYSSSSRRTDGSSDRVDDRLLSGSRIRSSLTRFARLSYVKKNSQPPKKKLQRLQSELDLDDLSKNEIELKANLYFHIGNPIKRWKVDRVVPVKLLLQLLKTFCLIVQVILFTITIPHQRSEFFYNSRIIFESLFIKNFQNGIIEPRDYYYAYNIQDIFGQFEYISSQYFALPEITIGGYDFESIDELGNPTPITMELTQYQMFEFNATNNSYILNGGTNKITFNVGKNDNATQVYLDNSQDPLFHRFVSLVVRMRIKNIRVVDPERAECFLFIVTITYENVGNTGKIRYLLEESHDPLYCNEDVETRTEDIEITYGFLTALDVVIIIMCLLSIILTVGTLRRATKLAKAMRKFYRKQLGIKLKWWEVRSLFPLWHLVNTISDLLILAGTFYKIFLDYEVNGLDNADPTALLLGIAVLFQAGVILRYISYFKELNALTRTMMLAFPELLKFLVCTAVLFLAFVINGWITLGPYHEKFETFVDSFETLFSLINGDDIYMTFIGIDKEDHVLFYWYSRIYMYIFLVLFLYFVLNLFTSLVITAHEASRTYNTAYENEVRRFVFSGPLTPRGAALRDVTETKNYVDPDVILKRMKVPPPQKESKPRTRSREYDESESNSDF